MSCLRWPLYIHEPHRFQVDASSSGSGALTFYSLVYREYRAAGQPGKVHRYRLPTLLSTFLEEHHL